MGDKYDLPNVDGDGNQDVCSFVASFINQRQSVERLLSWLRESQTTCTDTNCFDDLTGLPGPEQSTQIETSSGYLETDGFSLVMWFVIIQLTLFAVNLVRDRDAIGSVSNKSNNNDRFRGNNDGDDGSSPNI